MHGRERDTKSMIGVYGVMILLLVIQSTMTNDNVQGYDSCRHRDYITQGFLEGGEWFTITFTPKRDPCLYSHRGSNGVNERKVTIDLKWSRPCLDMF